MSISKGYIRLLNISKGYAFLLHMSMVYVFKLIDSISEVYTHVLFDVVSVDVCLYICILCTSCGNIIRFDEFRVIRFEIKVKDVEVRYNSIN